MYMYKIAHKCAMHTSNVHAHVHVHVHVVVHTIATAKSLAYIHVTVILPI